MTERERDSIRFEIKRLGAGIKRRKRDIKLYRKFRRNKGGRAAPKFFTRHYFRKGLKYDIYGQVYGLPTYVDKEVWEPVQVARQRRKRMRPPPRKKFNWELILPEKGSNWKKR